MLKTRLILLICAALLCAGCPSSNVPLNQMQVAAKQYAELSDKYEVKYTGYNFDAVGNMDVTFSCDCVSESGEPVVFLIKVNVGHPAQTILQKTAVLEQFKFNYTEERLDAKSSSPESAGSHLQFVSQKGGQST